MNDTENRLRDYLDSKAATIPDDLESPGLIAPSRHRRSWPIVLAAAAIAAIVVAAVPVAMHLSGKDKPPPPAEKPSNELRIPYVTSVDNRYPTQDKSVPTLHDGKQTVPSLAEFTPYVGRVGGGWLTWRPTDGKPTRAGLLMPDGSFVPLGPVNSNYALPSPDRKQIATTLPLGNHKTKVLVIDVATRKEVASVTLPHRTTMIWGWNKDGIWLGEDYNIKTQPMVWQPGSGQPIRLSIPGFDSTVVAPSTTDKVLVETRGAGNSLCMNVGTLTGNKFAVTRQYCQKGNTAIYPVLSPDGRTMIHSEQKIAIDVATGKVTKLRLDHSLQGFPKPVFEDATHLITLPAPLAAGPNGRGVIPPGTPTDANGIPLIGFPVYRCDVTTGSCAHVFTTEPRINIELAEP